MVWSTDPARSRPRELSAVLDDLGAELRGVLERLESEEVPPGDTPGLVADLFEIERLAAAAAMLLTTRAVHPAPPEGRRAARRGARRCATGAMFTTVPDDDLLAIGTAIDHDESDVIDLDELGFELDER